MEMRAFLEEQIEKSAAALDGARLPKMRERAAAALARWQAELDRLEGPKMPNPTTIDPAG